MHKVVKFNREAWLKPYIDMNTKLRTIDFFKLMNNAVFGKAMENNTKHRNFNLVTTSKRRGHLLSEFNYHTTKCFSENLLAIEMKKIKVNMRKLVNISLSILEIS